MLNMLLKHELSKRLPQYCLAKFQFSFKIGLVAMELFPKLLTGHNMFTKYVKYVKYDTETRIELQTSSV